jgi:hypothetical protein
MLSRTLGVALVVGLVAFLAGLQFAPPRETVPTAIVTAPTAIVAAPTVLPDRSSFATSFDPDALLHEAGLAACLGDGGGRGGGRAYLISSGSCSVPEAQQPALILELEREISTAIRERATSRGGGFTGTYDQGPIVTSWEYRSDGFDGNVYLVATHAGSDLQVTIILTEQFEP